MSIRYRARVHYAGGGWWIARATPDKRARGYAFAPDVWHQARSFEEAIQWADRWTRVPHESPAAWGSGSIVHPKGSTTTTWNGGH